MPGPTNLLAPLDTQMNPRNSSSSRASSRAPSFISTTSINSPPATQRLLEEGYVDPRAESDSDNAFLRAIPGALCDVLSIKTQPEPDRENKFGEKRRSSSPRKRWTCSVGSRLAARAIRYVLIALGCLLATSLVWHVTSACYEPYDDLPALLDEKEPTEKPTDRHWFHAGVTGYSYHGPAFNNILPIPCHSHNDYWRSRPLFSALRSGCVSVEADVWMFDDDLFVGHDRKSLNHQLTLESLYIEPLLSILNSTNEGFAATEKTPNGVFGKDPSQSLVLLIDLKMEGPEILAKVHEQLAPLREKGLLTHWNGTARIERPVTVVLSGEADFAMITASKTYRDMFFDAPLDALVKSSDPLPTFDAHSSHAKNVHEFYYNPSNSYFASVRMTDVLGYLDTYQLPPAAVATLRRQINDAHERGLLSRYWSHANWPASLRDHTWEVLLEEQVGMLNVDDLKAVKRLARGMRSVHA